MYRWLYSKVPLRKHWNWLSFSIRLFKFIRRGNKMGAVICPWRIRYMPRISISKSKSRGLRNRRTRLLPKWISCNLKIRDIWNRWSGTQKGINQDLSTWISVVLNINSNHKIKIFLTTSRQSTPSQSLAKDQPTSPDNQSHQTIYQMVEI